MAEQPSHRQARIGRTFALGHITGGGAHPFAALRRVAAEAFYGAGVAPRQPEKQPQGGGLAGAVLPREEKDSTLRHRQVKPVERDRTAVAFDQGPALNGEGRGTEARQHLRFPYGTGHQASSTIRWTAAINSSACRPWR